MDLGRRGGKAQLYMVVMEDTVAGEVLTVVRDHGWWSSR